MDDHLCLPESVSGGQILVSCMKAVGSCNGRGDWALSQSSSSQVTLRITLVMMAGHDLPPEGTNPAGSDQIGALWSNQTSLGGLNSNHHLHMPWLKLVVTVLERSSLRQNPFFLPGPPLEMGGYTHIAPLRWSSLHPLHQSCHLSPGWWWHCSLHFTSVWTPAKVCPWKAPSHSFPVLTPPARAGAPCKPVHAETHTKGCASPAVTVTRGEGSARAPGKHSSTGLLLHGEEEEAHSVSPSCHTASRTAPGHSSAQLSSTAGRSAGRPESICPSKYALNSTKLAPPFNDEVGEFYWQCESRCPVLWEGCCPCYTYTSKHGCHATLVLILAN